METTLPNLKGEEVYTYMELVLYGLAEFNVLNKDFVNNTFTFKDLLANMLDDEDIFGDMNEDDE